ncbi:hypothetical protein JG688_00011867 [Phytophthora aleatoria]|uniref:Uncharacterized protein n=1 Tax=Phytophthora aleatoria TaxID=2496075 RepID=A0A8J5J3Q8_9STRA|nr:hypothetical protein JG688_00011867 [Phytophthora aleatoria]
MLQLKRADNGKRKRSDAQQETKKVKATQVKTAYAIRKERKRLLMEQAGNMQDKLDKLKFRLLVKQGQIEKDTKRTVAENAVLHEYIQEQHITLATTQAALTGHVFGSITIREDSEFENAELAQLRLVSLVSSGATVESNTAVFSKLAEGANGEYGIMAADFVDFDELHPYRSSERVRQDTTTSLMPEIELMESSVCWGDTAQKCIEEQLTNAATFNSPLPF